ncbi:MAG TPA: sialidase family protein, partial [Ktedonobacterales bacterium]
TDDGGATWHDLALPVQNLDLNNTQFSIMVSPVDPHFVILTIVIFQAVSCPPPGQASIAGSPVASSGRPGSGLVRLSSNTYASSGPPCTLQYDSADGGNHWAHLALPLTGTLGTTPYGNQFSEQALRAQGTQLYAMHYAESSLIYGACSCSAPTGRLITSADGGATWRLADDGLPSDVGIGDYAPAPMGQAIFVVTDRSDAFGQSAAWSPPPDLKLWRSDDAGGHWSLVGSLPFQVITGIRVVPMAGNAQPLIYLGTGGKGGSAPTGLQVSTDGGHTWAAAQRQPAQQVGAAPPVLWGVLADGSALVSFTLAQSGASGSTTLYAWKPGDVTWRQLAPPLSTTLITSLLVVPTGSGSGARIWVVESLPNGAATAYFDVS